jgi:hypothetical protein
LQTALNNHLNDTTKVRPMDSHQLWRLQQTKIHSAWQWLAHS